MKRRVLVFGTFDGLHEGHRAFLRQARTCAEDIPSTPQSFAAGRAGSGNNSLMKSTWLVAIVARDEVVEKLKGRRPSRELRIRKHELRKTGLVDEVVEGDIEIGRWEVIGKIKPDIIALGYDQVALKKTLLRYIQKKNLGIEVRTMEAYKPEEFHSSIISKS